MAVMSKEQRQRRIQEIISSEIISTQSDLVKRLIDENIEVTQATVSRDINELRLVRLPIGKGRHRYTLTSIAVQKDTMDELRRRFREFVHSIDYGNNLVIIRTEEGHANGVAYLVDKLKRGDMVGTLAGQDTILLVMRTNEDAGRIVDDFREFLN